MTLLAQSPTTHFPAPVDATAPTPAEERGLRRDEVRLLVARPDRIEHVRFRDLADHLDPGDLLVVNDSATVAGEVDGLLDGQPVVVHVAHHLPDSTWVVELRSHPAADRAVLDARVGQHLALAGITAELVDAYPREASPTGHGNRLWRASADGDLRAALDRYGRAISYGYLDRHYPLAAYQSIFSREPGSAEMPSAGRPFTPELVTRLVSRGVGIAPVTLHTGLSSQEAAEPPQAEWYAVPAATAHLVNATREHGGRVVAVGTTVTRALESSVENGRAVASSGWTERVVSTAEPAQVVGGLVTGWHDPQASHLLLVESIAGSALTQVAYDAAVAHHYLWHEFGDAGLLLP